VVNASSSNNAFVRRALLTINPAITLRAADSLDLRAHAKVSAVVGVPLRQLQQRRDVVAFATSAPMAALKGLLELLALAPLDEVIEHLGDHAESPTYEQLAKAIDELLTSGSSIDDAVAVLAYAISESFPAAPHCRRLFEEREVFALAELPEIVAPTVLASPREVNPAIREQRRARREEEKRRKKPNSLTRPSRPTRSKIVPPSSHPSAKSHVDVTPAPPSRRRLLFTPLELSRFDVAHPLVGAVLLVEVPFDALDPDLPDVSSKERPALVVAASGDELLLRPIYSNPSTTRSIFQPWRRVGLDHVSYIDDVRVVVANVDPHVQVGQLTVSEWNALS